jgi:hypothetical protein
MDSTDSPDSSTATAADAAMALLADAGYAPGPGAPGLPEPPGTRDGVPAALRPQVTRLGLDVRPSAVPGEHAIRSPEPGTPYGLLIAGPLLLTSHGRVIPEGQAGHYLDCYAAAPRTPHDDLYQQAARSQPGTAGGTAPPGERSCPQDLYHHARDGAATLARDLGTPCYVHQDGRAYVWSPAGPAGRDWLRADPGGTWALHSAGTTRVLDGKPGPHDFSTLNDEAGLLDGTDPEAGDLPAAVTRLARSRGYPVTADQDRGTVTIGGDGTLVLFQAEPGGPLHNRTGRIIPASRAAAYLSACDRAPGTDPDQLYAITTAGDEDAAREEKSFPWGDTAACVSHASDRAAETGRAWYLYRDGEAVVCTGRDPDGTARYAVTPDRKWAASGRARPVTGSTPGLLDFRSLPHAEHPYSSPAAAPDSPGVINGETAGRPEPGDSIMPPPDPELLTLRAALGGYESAAALAAGRNAVHTAAERLSSRGSFAIVTGTAQAASGARTPRDAAARYGALRAEARQLAVSAGAIPPFGRPLADAATALARAADHHLARLHSTAGLAVLLPDATDAIPDRAEDPLGLEPYPYASYGSYRAAHDTIARLASAAASVPGSVFAALTEPGAGQFGPLADAWAAAADDVAEAFASDSSPDSSDGVLPDLAQATCAHASRLHASRDEAARQPPYPDGRGYLEGGQAAARALAEFTGTHAGRLLAGPGSPPAGSSAAHLTRARDAFRTAEQAVGEMTAAADDPGPGLDAALTRAETAADACAMLQISVDGSIWAASRDDRESLQVLATLTAEHAGSARATRDAGTATAIAQAITASTETGRRLQSLTGLAARHGMTAAHDSHDDRISILPGPGREPAAVQQRPGGPLLTPSGRIIPGARHDDYLTAAAADPDADDDTLYAAVVTGTPPEPSFSPGAGHADVLETALRGARDGRPRHVRGDGRALVVTATAPEDGPHFSVAPDGTWTASPGAFPLDDGAPPLRIHLTALLTEPGSAFPVPGGDDTAADGEPAEPRAGAIIIEHGESQTRVLGTDKNDLDVRGLLNSLKFDWSREGFWYLPRPWTFARRDRLAMELAVGLCRAGHYPVLRAAGPPADPVPLPQDAAAEPYTSLRDVTSAYLGILAAYDNADARDAPAAWHHDAGRADRRAVTAADRALRSFHEQGPGPGAAGDLDATLTVLARLTGDCARAAGTFQASLAKLRAPKWKPKLEALTLAAAGTAARMAATVTAGTIRAVPGPPADAPDDATAITGPAPGPAETETAAPGTGTAARTSGSPVTSTENGPPGPEAHGAAGGSAPGQDMVPSPPATPSHGHSQHPDPPPPAGDGPSSITEPSWNAVAAATRRAAATGKPQYLHRAPADGDFSRCVISAAPPRLAAGYMTITPDRVSTETWSGVRQPAPARSRNLTEPDWPITLTEARVIADAARLHPHIIHAAGREFISLSEPAAADVPVLCWEYGSRDIFAGREITTPGRALAWLESYRQAMNDLQDPVAAGSELVHDWSRRAALLAPHLPDGPGHDRGVREKLGLAAWHARGGRADQARRALEDAEAAAPGAVLSPARAVRLAAAIRAKAPRWHQMGLDPARYIADDTTVDAVHPAEREWIRNYIGSHPEVTAASSPGTGAGQQQDTPGRDEDTAEDLLNRAQDAYQAGRPGEALALTDAAEVRSPAGGAVTGQIRALIMTAAAPPAPASAPVTGPGEEPPGAEARPAARPDPTPPAPAVRWDRIGGLPGGRHYMFTVIGGHRVTVNRAGDHGPYRAAVGLRQIGEYDDQDTAMKMAAAHARSLPPSSPPAPPGPGSRPDQAGASAADGRPLPAAPRDTAASCMDTTAAALRTREAVLEPGFKDEYGDVADALTGAAAAIRGGNHNEARNALGRARGAISPASPLHAILDEHEIPAGLPVFTQPPPAAGSQLSADPPQDPQPAAGAARAPAGPPEPEPAERLLALPPRDASILLLTRGRDCADDGLRHAAEWAQPTITPDIRGMLNRLSGLAAQAAEGAAAHDGTPAGAAFEDDAEELSALLARTLAHITAAAARQSPPGPRPPARIRNAATSARTTGPGNTGRPSGPR